MTTHSASPVPAGRDAEAVAALERSLAGGKGDSDAFNLYFLAMARHRLGQAARAREDLTRAIRWSDAHPSLPADSVVELRAFRAEAEALLLDPASRRPVHTGPAGGSRAVIAEGHFCGVVRGFNPPRGRPQKGVEPPTSHRNKVEAAAGYARESRSRFMPSQQPQGRGRRLPGRCVVGPTSAASGPPSPSLSGGGGTGVRPWRAAPRPGLAPSTRSARTPARMPRPRRTLRMSAARNASDGGRQTWAVSLRKFAPGSAIGPPSGRHPVPALTARRTRSPPSVA